MKKLLTLASAILLLTSSLVLSSSMQRVSATPAPFVSFAAAVNPTGGAQNSFARGTSVNITCLLNTIAWNMTEVWRIIIQEPDLTVYSIVSSTMYLNPNHGQSTIILFQNETVTMGQYVWASVPISTTQVISISAQTGAWTAYVQIFAPDGITPLIFATVPFNVT